MLPQAKSSRPRTTIGSFAFVGSAIDSVDRRVDAISTDRAVERSEQLLSPSRSRSVHACQRTRTHTAEAHRLPLVCVRRLPLGGAWRGGAVPCETSEPPCPASTRSCPPWASRASPPLPSSRSPSATRRLAQRYNANLGFKVRRSNISETLRHQFPIGATGSVALCAIRVAQPIAEVTLRTRLTSHEKDRLVPTTNLNRRELGLAHRKRLHPLCGGYCAAPCMYCWISPRSTQPSPFRSAAINSP